MLRIINVKKGLPISYCVAPEEEKTYEILFAGVPKGTIYWYDEKFHPGQIAQLFRNPDGIVCGTSDGTSAVGIIDDIRDSELGDDSTQGIGRITVWNVIGMVAETDQFDNSSGLYPNNYRNGTQLFVNTDAKLSTFKLFPEQTPVAKVIRFNKKTGMLRFKWLGHQPLQSFDKP